MNQIKIFGVLIMAVIVVSINNSCKPKDTNPEELITTLKLNFTKGGITKSFQFIDIDGISGGNAGVFDTIYLDTNSTYNLSLEVLNESVSPAEDITAEIREEAIDHQFFFNPSSGLNLTSSYNDLDIAGQPIGLTNIISTGANSVGTLRVNLKHQPGIKNNNQNTGESDIDVSFYIVIK